MTGAISAKTKNFGLNLINFDFPRWSTYDWQNWQVVDAALALTTSAIKGPWANSTAYAIGDRLVDTDLGTLWVCKVAHTSPATGLFGDSRTANPTYWGAYGGTPSYRGVWSGTGFSYSNGDVVQVSNKWYLCVSSHVSDNASNTTANTSLWTLIIDNSLAITSAANAATSEANALSYKNAASTSAGNAATSEANALSYKNAASTSAGNASTSEGNALSYKNAANTSAGNAATSESNALASANLAAQWATSLTVVSGGLYGAKKYANDAATSATQAATFNPALYAALASSAAFNGFVVSYGTNTDNTQGTYYWGQQANNRYAQNSGNTLTFNNMGLKLTGNAIGSWSTSGWQVRMQLKQGDGIHWLSNTGNSFAGLIGFSGDTFYVGFGSDATNGTSAPSYGLQITNSSGSLNGYAIWTAGTLPSPWYSGNLVNPITLGNFTAYFTMRKAAYGQQGAYGGDTWAGSPMYSGPAGAFMTSIYISWSSANFYVYYYFLQWAWNGTYYTVA